MYNKFIKILIILIIILSNIISCSSNSDEEETGLNVDLNWSSAISEYIYGLVEIDDEENIYIVEDWESRSKKSYKVYGDLKDTIKNNVNKYIFVNGSVISNEDNPFSMDIKVNEILIVNENPEPDWSNTKEEVIVGKIENCQDNIPCIIKDWESKSRVSYYVYGEYREEIRKNIEKYAKVNGFLVLKEETEETKFNKDLLVLKIIEISNEPIGE